jgi:hypothetical protein
MMARTAWLLSVYMLPLVAEEPPRAIQVAEPPQAAAPARDQVKSRSEQFRISGGDPLVRGTLAILADETKDEFLRLIGDRDGWKVPVHVRLDARPVAVRMRLLEVEGVRELRFDFHFSRGIDHERFKRAVVTSLLYERVLRKPGGNAADAPLNVPPWLSDGLREAVVWRQNQSDRDLYQALFRQGGLLKPDNLFRMADAAFENLDGATRAAFRVSSGAMVMALLEQPQGREGFRAYLDAAPSYEGEMPGLLARHFPELNLSESSLRKWWTLQLANKGGLTQLTDLLTVAQTETALNEALKLHFRTAEGIVNTKELAAWPELAELEEPERVSAVRPAEEALVRLSYRCFPSYRPLLMEYQDILVSIARDKTGKVAGRLLDLDETRVTMVARANRARDYLDWFEITTARETSGAFDDYQRLKERLKSNPHRRKDPVSDYLDRMERIFHREDGTNGPPP